MSKLSYDDDDDNDNDDDVVHGKQNRLVSAEI
jgi:hypothetical protein